MRDTKRKRPGEGGQTAYRSTGKPGRLLSSGMSGDSDGENEALLGRYAPKINVETEKMLEEQYVEGGSDGFFRSF